MITRSNISQTKIFIQSNRVIQQMLIGRVNLKAINTGFDKVQQIGFDQYQMETRSGINNQEIIKELLNFKTNKSGKKNRSIKRKNETIGSNY